ncbi:sodium-coupled monocarboxylate transporter 1-like [Periplaneta americana]|uniref:sodium-coupled monocarboxylate transporter 1-like n=1 Tax=Periplaneta americana TaxID=6978 RepID=UPI0037E8B6DE
MTSPPLIELMENFTNGTAQCNEHNRFHWADYLVLAVMFVVSGSIGLFYGCFGKKQTTASDFLLGGSAMGTFPMAMSLASSFITAIELLGNPAEMYVYGTQFWMTCIAFILVIPITSDLYLPVYRKLKLTSAYEYLEMRFSPSVRTFGAVLYMLQMILYTSVAVYAPALALSHVTGLNTYIAVSCIYVVCIFYASQGGMKAVIITDTFQAGILIGSILITLTVGNKLAGGSSVVWGHNYDSNRIELFTMDPNPTVRHSFWSVVIGGTFYWLSMFCSNQASIQKYLSVKDTEQVKRALWVSCVGLILIFTINFYTGMLMYVEYHDCDPLRSNRITASDQLLPLYVMSTMGNMHGIPGIFVAGIFSASLGTVAAALNSLTAVTVKDFLQGAFKYELPEEQGAKVGKWISFGFGVFSFALVFVVEHLGSVLQVALSFNGMVGGITLGLFSLGMFFPWANAKGALCGAVLATGLVLWIGIGTQIAIAGGAISYEQKYTSVQGCLCGNMSEVLNATASPVLETASESKWWLEIYKLSYLWYSLLGFLITIIVGLIMSILTGSLSCCRLDEDLMSPPVRKLLESLPTYMKQILRLPLETKESTAFGKTDEKRPYYSSVGCNGIQNISFVMEDENQSAVYRTTAINGDIKI